MTFHAASSEPYDFVRFHATGGFERARSGVHRPWTAAQNLYTVVLLLLVIGSVVAVAVATSPFTS